MQKVDFLDNYKTKLPFKDTDGTKLFNLEIFCINQENGINLYLCQEGDEPFEPNSHSSIKIPLFNIIEASIDWRKGDYHLEHNAIIGTINELEYVIGQLKIKYKDLIEENIKNQSKS